MKKWFKWCVLSSFSILIAVGYITYNIKYYSVHYAKYTPYKDGVEPVLMVLVDEVFWIKREYLSKYNYKDDKYISIMENGEQKYLYSSSYNIVDEQRNYSYSSDLANNKKYIFDEKFKLKYVFNTINYTELDNNLFDEQAIKQEMYEVYKELIDRQPTPSINLQWLFDWLYHDKFN